MRPYFAALVRLSILTMLAAAGLAEAVERPALKNDGVHDPANPSLFMLQEANDIIASLPRDTAGAFINWDEAMEQRNIEPRQSILLDDKDRAPLSEAKIKASNLDVIMPKTSQAPMVLFPHRQHTEWIDCESCHDELFSSKAGKTPVTNMYAILNGKSCGLCHGAVAFPLTECRRCHSVRRAKK